MTVPLIDNLIIGGGLAGSLVAIRLAAAGQPVTLLEKEHHAHHKVCGEFLSPEAVAYLRQVAVDPLALGAVEIRNLHFSSQQRIAQAALPFSALSLSRRALDEALLARAAESGCTIRRGISVENLNPEGDLHAIRLSNGESLLARTVFLATGKHDLRGFARSSTRQSDLIGFKLHLQLAPAQTRLLRGVIELFLFPGGYGGISLVENDVANLCLVVRRTRIRAFGGWSEFLASILHRNASIRERLQGANTLWQRPLAVSPIPYGYLADRPAGLWCVGDQAAVIPSFTGDGMAIALHSAALAAQMHLAGESSAAYLRKLRSQLGSGMSLATALSRFLVTAPGRGLAPLALALVPSAMRWIAASTRVPTRALVPIAPLANSSPAR